MAHYIVIEGEGRDTDQHLIEKWEFTPDEDFNNKVYRIHDTTDSSETLFWRRFNEFICGGKYIIKPSFGNGEIGFILKHLVNRSSTESIVLCYDWYVDDDTSNSLRNIFRKYEEICYGKGIEFIQKYKTTQ